MNDKQNLKPELKEVYDRIMNTEVKASKEKEPEKTPDEHKVTPATPPHGETHTSQSAASIAQTHPASSSPTQLPNVNRDQSFAFSTKDHKLVSAHEPKAHAEKGEDKGQKISKEIIIALVVIFFIVYAGLCAVLLGIIQF